MKQWQIFLMAGLFLAVCNSLGDAEAATSPVTLETDIYSANVLEGDYIMATLTLTNTDTEFRKQEVYLHAVWPTGLNWTNLFTDTNQDEIQDNLIRIGREDSQTVKIIVFCAGPCSAGDVNTVLIYAKTDPVFYNDDGSVTDTCGSDDCETDTTPANQSANITNTVSIEFTARTAYAFSVDCDSASDSGTNEMVQGWTSLWGYDLMNTGWNNDNYQFTTVVSSNAGGNSDNWIVNPGILNGKELDGQIDKSSSAVHSAKGAISIMPASDTRPGVYSINLQITSTNANNIVNGCTFDVVVPEPDLEVKNTDLSFNKYNSCLHANSSDKVTIYAHIRNNGGIVDASGVRTANIEVVFIIDGNQYGSTQIIESLYYGEEILIYTHWNPVRGEDSNDEISIIVAVDPHDYIGEADNSNNEGKGSYIVKEYQTTPGIEGGEVIGYDISLARSVTGSWIASEDGSGVWTVQNVKFQPQISIDLVHWHLIDEQGKNVSDGITSHIYGYYPGNGKSVVFIDNDLNCMLSPGDKFVVYPGEADSDLANISDIADYQMRFMTKDSPAPEEEIVDKESKEEEVEEIVDKESEEEEVEVPAISLIAAIAVLGTVVIFRRK